MTSTLGSPSGPLLRLIRGGVVIDILWTLLGAGGLLIARSATALPWGEVVGDALLALAVAALLAVGFVWLRDAPQTLRSRVALGLAGARYALLALSTAWSSLGGAADRVLAAQVVVFLVTGILAASSFFLLARSGVGGKTDAVPLSTSPNSRQE